MVRIKHDAIASILTHTQRRRMKRIIEAMISIALIVFAFAVVAAEKPTAGLVLVGPKSDGGWSMRHYQGMKETGYEFDVIESVAETDSERVFRNLARKHDVVFGTSFGYMGAMENIAKKFPDVKFMHATGFKTAENLNNYNCRLFQARYLAGISAGLLTKSNKIGFVGSHPIPEIISNINAATLGAKSVNPDIEVTIVWINSWFDPGKDMAAARTLFNSGVDVFFTTTDSPSVVLLAQEKSTPEKPLWGMGNDAPMNSFGPDRYATGPMFNWEVYYSHVMKSVEDGTWKVDTPFWGMENGCVDLSPWGPNVPEEVVEIVESEKAKFVSEEYDASFPFSAGFTKQDGTVVNPGMGREGIESMDYFVDGVVTKF
jgi:basic membrane protein A